MQGEGIPANAGIVPPSFKQYDHKSLEGYEFDPEKAISLLEAAGYGKGGKKFPNITLDINSGGQEHIRVSEVVQGMLKENLGVNVALNVLPRAQQIEKYERQPPAPLQLNGHKGAFELGS